MSTLENLLLGCVADDFTGASDAASFLSDNGMQTLLISGLPDQDLVLPAQTQAIVIALKTRTVSKNRAVAESMQAFKWLQNQGARMLYFKYCSTFDSTRDGNIGPIADRMLESLATPFTLICPALPVNGRTVKNGMLFVNDIPLHESPMKDHPLTPMWDARLKELLEPQSRYPAFNLSIEQMDGPIDQLKTRIQQLSAEHSRFYLIPDQYNEQHAELIVSLFGDLPLLTGGSGLLSALAKKLLAQSDSQGGERVVNHTDGDAIILAGSCSNATLSQIADFQTKGGLSFQIKPLELIQNPQLSQRIQSFMKSHPKKPILIFSSDTADVITQVQTQLGNDIADRIEGLFADLAQYAIQNSRKRVIVAGGETSGAVTQRLGFTSFLLGDSIAPGVPVLVPVGHPEIRLVLKSGNFGQVDFFTRALRMTGDLYERT